ncbi:major facilitator superfamily domain-containing protein [Lasiosphaeria ovina]|uniref:Major facilitator superfamily domain-containing protein n=1 Tax=Lasiosphaeria ovina TaxID=92902 RepID=A0AAE0KGB2_9PEZI|nr:major facilitator superfamily domain-containing protein [Lasiosphaeria ovina]
MEANERTRLLPEDAAGIDENNMVSWDGPDDPENPINWSDRSRWGHVALVSALTFLMPLSILARAIHFMPPSELNPFPLPLPSLNPPSPLGATMFAPAIQQVTADLHTKPDSVLASLAVSVYVLGWALGPLALAPLSETHGRLVVYTWSNVLYVACTAGCALAPTAEALVAARFLAGAVGSTPLAIGAGTIADLVPVQRRGLALSLYMLGPILGPSVGPLVGGYVTDTLGWRWIFWLLAAVYALATLFQLALMRETYPATILAAKTARLRLAFGTTHPPLRSKLDPGLTPSQILRRAVLRPAKLTLTSPIAWLSSLVSAYVNGVAFLLLTTLPVLLQSVYGFSPRAVGLAFAGYGAGNVAGLAAFSLTSDRLVRRSAVAGRLTPEHRLAPAVAALPLIAAGLLGCGWSAAMCVHWAWVVAASALVGAGNVLFFSAVVGYLIDATGPYAASAIAANTVLRSVGGTLLPLAGAGLYAAPLGWGWGDTLLAAVALGLTPAMAWLYFRGAAVRERFPVKL